MESIYLGITQGLTEFLPISSSGHLYILQNYLRLDHGLLPFFIFLHLATLLALCTYLRKEIIDNLRKKTYLFQIGIISIVTFLVGWFIDRNLSIYFESKVLVAIFLFINGIILFFSKSSIPKRSITDLTLRDALILGFVQGLAVLPGISRSGITIVTLLRRGVKVKEAFTFSFIMAIPVISGVFLSKARELSSLKISALDLAFSFASAFIFGLFGLVIVKSTLINKKFANFGYYCIIISLLILIF